MPSLMPLLSSPSYSAGTNASVSTPPKKTPNKLRRRNPPPALAHQKLPSAGSSIVSLPKSRPSSSRSSGNGAWPGTAAAAAAGLRKSEDHPRRPGEDWSSDPFLSSVPPVPSIPSSAGLGMGIEISRSGMMTPPELGSPGLYRSSPQYIPHASYGNTPPPSAQRDYFPIPSLPARNSKGKDALRGFSYDSHAYASPPQTDKHVRSGSTSSQPLYLGTAQYPNNLLAQQPPKLRSGPPEKSNTLPTGTTTTTSTSSSTTTTTTTGLTMLAPAQQQFLGRTPNGSPILPPLPSFQSGGFGFDMVVSGEGSVDRKKNSHYPGKRAFKPVPSSSPPTKQSDTPVEGTGDYVCHAITAEEPILLPSSSTSASSSVYSSPESLSVEFSQAYHNTQSPQDIRKSDGEGRFLGGWKLAMSSKNGGDELSKNINDTEGPVGVGGGGGWIHKRQGSFSSTRPPSAEKGRHKAFGQEYKEFRAQQRAEKRASEVGGDIKTTTIVTENFAATGGSAPLSPTFGQKLRAIEDRKKHESGASSIANMEKGDIVALDVAVRQMSLLESRISGGGSSSGGRPISPPYTPEVELKKSSGKDERAEKRYSESSENSHADSARARSSSSSSRHGRPGPPVGHKSFKKTKSQSPLRNEVDSSSSSPTTSEFQHHIPSSSSSSHHSANSQFPPPSEYLGKPRSTRTAARDSVATSRPPTPPKPIAKLFVICCRCKYWHDLPSAMYHEMVRNGGATRCPYCLHGMETTCCSGYTCVVYMHQRHH